MKGLFMFASIDILYAGFLLKTRRLSQQKAEKYLDRVRNS